MAKEVKNYKAPIDLPGGIQPPMDNTENNVEVTQLGEPTQGLLEALMKARADFPIIAATEEGQEGNRKFKYAPLDEIQPKCDPVLAKYGLLVTDATSVRIEESGMVLDIMATLWHPASGGAIHSDLAFTFAGTSAKELGKTLTYLRRYLFVTLVGLVIVNEDRLESERDRDAANGRKAVAKITEEQAMALLAKLTDNELDVQKFKRHFGLNPGDSMTELPATVFKDAVAAVEARIAQKGGGA